MRRTSLRRLECFQAYVRRRYARLYCFHGASRNDPASGLVGDPGRIREVEVTCGEDG